MASSTTHDLDESGPAVAPTRNTAKGANVSDPTNPGGAGDFRGSREEKRQDETIMINSDNLSDMVSQAKSADAVAPAAAAPTAGGPNLLYIAIGVAVLLVIVLAIVFTR